MNKVVAIIAGEPNSISSEIIFKSWKLKNKFTHKPFFIIGSIKLLNLQKKKLNYPIKLKKINNNFTLKDLKDESLPVYDINFDQKKPFEKIWSAVMEDASKTWKTTPRHGTPAKKTTM